MKTLLFFCLGLMLFACEPYEDIDTAIPGSLTPENEGLIRTSLIMPSGTQELKGKVPAAGNAQSPRVTIEYSEVSNSNGGTASIKVSHENVENNLAGYYAQVEGSPSYLRIPYKGQYGANGKMVLPIGLPSFKDKGAFCITFYAFDVNGKVSSPARACVKILRFGTRTIQVNLG